MISEQKVISLIKKGESKSTEFKETFRFDIRTKKKNKQLPKEVSKAVCAMLNTEGGYLFIGVSDKGNIIGLERDLKLYGTWDAFHQDIEKILAENLGEKNIDSYLVTKKKVLNKDIIIIKIEISEYPVFHLDEDFHIRRGPASPKLNSRATYQYIDSHFKPNRKKEILDGEIEDLITKSFRNLDENYLKIVESLYRKYPNDIFLGLLFFAKPIGKTKDIIDFENTEEIKFIKDLHNKFSARNEYGLSPDFDHFMNDFNYQDNSYVSDYELDGAYTYNYGKVVIKRDAEINFYHISKTIRVDEVSTMFPIESEKLRKSALVHPFHLTYFLISWLKFLSIVYQHIKIGLDTKFIFALRSNKDIGLYSEIKSIQGNRNSFLIDLKIDKIVFDSQNILKKVLLFLKHFLRNFGIDFDEFDANYKKIFQKSVKHYIKTIIK